MEVLYENLLRLFTVSGAKMLIMWIIGGVLIFLAIKKEMEPTLLLPLGFGTIMVNLPLSGAITQGLEEGALSVLYDAGIANELFPLILFIGIGAMIDFGPVLSNPKLMLFGGAAQFGIFFTLCLASMFFPQIDAASIAIIGAADGPTAIVVANKLGSQYLGAIMVAAYSYMALVPIIQPPVIKLLTTKKERLIRMPYRAANVSKTTRILFPIIITVVAGLIAPSSVSLIGFLMFGNLLRECGVLDSLSETAQKVLANLVTIFLGITIATRMQADLFLQWETLLILGLGLGNTDILSADMIVDMDQSMLYLGLPALSKTYLSGDLSYEMDFAEMVADRIVFMADGIVIEDGSASQVINNPVNERTKAFIAGLKAVC